MTSDSPPYLTGKKKKGKEKKKAKERKKKKKKEKKKKNKELSGEDSGLLYVFLRRRERSS
jgi:hypothetical protein